jgi:MtN3 and saliva related transmembrane protein|tara:strand:- start:101 stop:373 length:273 start_codon:yes stop_codon:yes gene_type:complete
MKDYITMIGLLAGTLSIIALIPQVWKTYITKHSKDLSMKWLLLTFISQLLWFTFGMLSNVLPVILTSSLTCVMTSSLIIMKRKFDDENKN